MTATRCFTTDHSPARSTLHGARPRRGAAMLLILISLTIATIVATAYLASRDNSAMIGQTVSASTSARWSAASGIDLAAAVLNTDLDLSALSGGQPLISDMPVTGGGSLTVDVRDLEHGRAPQANSFWLHMTSTVVQDGVPQTALAIAEVDPIVPTAQLDLADFAIFAVNTIDLAGEATIARWDRSRLAALGNRLHLGTTSDLNGAVQVRGNAAAIDATLVHSATGAHVLSVTSSATPALETARVQQPIPAAAPPAPAAFGPLPDNIPEALVLSSQTRTISGDVQTLSINAVNSVINVAADQTVVVLADLMLSASEIHFAGNARLVVQGSLRAWDSRMVVAPGSRLDIFIGGPVRFVRTYIGEPTVETADASGLLEYQSVAQRFIWSIPPDPEDGVDPAVLGWSLESDSVVVAQLYAPDRAVRLTQAAAVYGRIAALSVSIDSASALFYDPSLDRQLGYASQDGPMYGAPGDIRGAMRTLSSLNPAALSTLSHDTNLVVLAGGRRLNNADPEKVDPADLFYPDRPRVRIRPLGQGLLPATIESKRAMVRGSSSTYATSEGLLGLTTDVSDPLIEDDLSKDWIDPAAAVVDEPEPPAEVEADVDCDDDDDEGVITEILKKLFGR